VRKIFEGMGLGLDSGWYSAASVKDRDCSCCILFDFEGQVCQAKASSISTDAGLLRGGSLSAGRLDDQLLVAFFPPAALRCLLVMGKVDDH
jgi:hypothetical protein